MAFVGALIVSTKRNRGHIGSITPSQSAANKASASNDPGATGDRGRDVVAGSLSVESGETARPRDGELERLNRTAAFFLALSPDNPSA